MNVREIIEVVNVIAPFQIAEEWDNCGLQAGDPDQEVNRIVIGLDVCLELLEYAVEQNCSLVLTHHPLLMNPLKTIDFQKMAGRVIKICAKNDISIVSAHTNLDKAQQGLNDYFASKIGLQSTGVFIPDNDAVSREKGNSTGIGRIGDLGRGIKLSEFVQEIKQRLALGHARITGDLDRIIKRAAVCTGSGGSLINDFLKSNADVYITGDIKYHDARLVEENEKALIDVGHFGSEKIAVELLCEKLSHALDKINARIEIIKYTKERDPFIII